MALPAPGSQTNPAGVPALLIPPHLQDVHFLAAMGLPGGGRTFVTSRYLRHFHCWAVTEASDANLKHIFATIQAWFLATHGFGAAVQELK